MVSTPITFSLSTGSGNPVGEWNNIPYNEFPTNGWTANITSNTDSEAGRILQVRWQDVAVFIDYLLYRNNFTLPDGTIYYVGAEHPVFGGLYVDGCQVNPYTGITTAESTFDYAAITLHYKSLPIVKNDNQPVTVREDEVEPDGIIVSIPRATVTIKSLGGNTVVKPLHDQPVYLPILKITSTLLNVSRVPLGTINATTNHISDRDLSFRFGGQTYTIPKDTILYCGASSKRTVQSNGVEKYNVTHRFICSPIHNKVYDPTSTATDLISRFVLPSDGYLNYTPASFSGLGV